MLQGQKRKAHMLEGEVHRSVTDDQQEGVRVSTSPLTHLLALSVIQSDAVQKAYIRATAGKADQIRGCCSAEC